MKLRFLKLSSCFTAGLVAFCLTKDGFAVALRAQSALSEGSGSVAPPALVAKADLPDAPRPQLDTVTAVEEDGSSSSQDPAVQTPADGAQGKPIPQGKTQRDLAEEQLKQQQKQRILGVVPNFNTSYVYGAAPLTSKQKYKLALRSAIDPVQIFGVTPFVALIGQADADHYGYGGGIEGYSKRYGQTFADNFDGTMLGNAVLPSLLHQDPRYFRLGRGSTKRRILYALGTNVIAHHDGNGRWEPNYSNVLGNLAAGGISNLYLPKDERGFGSTITGGLTVTAEGGLGSMFQEFWPDISRHFLHKDPTGGQDDINRSQPDPTEGRHLFSNKKN